MCVFVWMNFRTQRRRRVGRYPLFGGDSYFLIGRRRIPRLSDCIDIPSSRVLLPNVDPVLMLLLLLKGYFLGAKSVALACATASLVRSEMTPR